MNTTDFVEMLKENAARAEMRRDRYMVMEGAEYATVETYWSGYLDACIDLLSIIKRRSHGAITSLEDHIL